MHIIILFLSLSLSIFSFGKELKVPDETRTEVLTRRSGISVHFTYDELDNLISVQSSDGTIDYALTYDWEGGVFATDRLNQKTVYRKIDCQDQILEEVFPTGQEVHISYRGPHFTGVKVANYGEISYEYNGDALSKVKRIAPSGKVLYEHCYECNEPNHYIKETLIQGLGELYHYSNPDTKEIEITTPFGPQHYQCDGNQNITYRKLSEKSDYFHYDHSNQLLLDDSYDEQGTPTGAQVNENGQIISYREITCTYDEDGNLIQKVTPKGISRFVYDAFNRLIKASTDECEISFTYDVFGRRLSKQVIHNGVIEEETYLYLGSNEIAVCDGKGNLKHLRIPGASFHPSVIKAVAIESFGEVFAPIYDHTCNLFQLVNSKTKEVTSFETLCPFGDNLQSFNSSIPWIYSSKHYDRELDLVYFGYRYYDPSLRRWTTRDLEETEGKNPYLYCENNPLKYLDPDGRFVIVVPIFVWGASAGGALVKVAAATAAAVAGYQAGKSYKKWKEKHKEHPPEPPYNGKDLGNDPKKCPGKGFKWHGDERGQWHNRKKRHSLRPDFNHPGDVKPHWDYQGPQGEEYRLNLDGTWELKR